MLAAAADGYTALGDVTCRSGRLPCPAVPAADAVYVEEFQGRPFSRMPVLLITNLIVFWGESHMIQNYFCFVLNFPVLDILGKIRLLLFRAKIGQEAQ